jgi:hypothetical protein
MTVIIIDDIVWNTPVQYRVESFPDYPDLQFMQERVRFIVKSQLDRHEVQSFCIRVDFVVNNTTLGTDWLSGCFYESLEYFIDNIGYFQDMCKNARLAAIANIRKLQAIQLPATPK